MSQESELIAENDAVRITGERVDGRANILVNRSRPNAQFLSSGLLGRDGLLEWVKGDASGIPFDLRDSVVRWVEDALSRTPRRTRADT